MGQRAGFVISSLLLVFALIVSSVFTVDQREAVMRFQLGEVVGVHTEPGLYLKIPVIQNLRRFDTRIQTLDGKDPERVNTVEKKNVVVDSFAKYRIIDIRQYFVAVRGDELQAQRRLEQTINNAVRAEFGTRTINEVVSGERDKIMEVVRDKVKEDAKGIGVEVIDVRLKRVDYVPEISDTVYKRMESERRRVAAELRSTGQGEAQKIKADADKQREVLIAEAYREAQKLKGEGDAKAAAIYADAYSRNAEFFSFYRSLDAYRASFRNRNDVIVIDPTSDFFKYFKDPGKRGK
jgi:modulator of FtsH protease HflC